MTVLEDSLDLSHERFEGVEREDGAEARFGLQSAGGGHRIDGVGLVEARCTAVREGGTSRASKPAAARATATWDPHRADPSTPTR